DRVRGDAFRCTDGGDVRMLGVRPIEGESADLLVDLEALPTCGCRAPGAVLAVSPRAEGAARGEGAVRADGAVEGGVPPMRERLPPALASSLDRCGLRLTAPLRERSAGCADSRWRVEDAEDWPR